jgi:predicted nuclease with TOPRIM domain
MCNLFQPLGSRVTGHSVVAIVTDSWRVGRQFAEKASSLLKGRHYLGDLDVDKGYY